MISTSTSFSPLLGAELFYLKDGASRIIRLGEEELQDFEKDMALEIERYQEAFRTETPHLELAK
jgi:hypothetical protein